MNKTGVSNVIHLISSGSRKVELGKMQKVDEKLKSGSEERRSEVRKK
jgi:hypothetical protein